MKKFKHLTVIMCVLLALIFVACKSTPKAEEPISPVEEKEQEKIESETTATEDQNYSESNQALLETVNAARDEAIASGADVANPEGFKAAELEYSAQVKASKDSSADLSVVMNDLISRYKALTAYTSAKAKKERIEQLDFINYGKNDYDQGCAILEELSKPTSNIVTGKELFTKADNAEKKFQVVLTTGFKSLARDERASAFKSKKDADSVKAAVSRKDDYDSGVSSFQKGDSNYVTNNPEGALDNYSRSKQIFDMLFTEISEARAKAQKAIDEAKARVAASSKAAKDADVLVPLGDTEVKGIENEDTILLEEDDFSSLENASVEVEETLSEGEAK